MMRQQGLETLLTDSHPVKDLKTNKINLWISF